MIRPAILISEVWAAPQRSFSASMLLSEDEPFTRDSWVQRSISKVNARSSRKPQENSCTSYPTKMSGSHWCIRSINAGKRSFSSATYWTSQSNTPDLTNKGRRGTTTPVLWDPLKTETLPVQVEAEHVLFSSAFEILFSCVTVKWREWKQSKWIGN